MSAQISITGTAAGVAAAQQALGQAVGDGSLVDALSAAGGRRFPQQPCAVLD